MSDDKNKKVENQETTQVVTLETVLPSDDSIPEKFRGKTMADVVKSYQEAEKLGHSNGQAKSDLEKKLQELESQLSTVKTENQQYEARLMAGDDDDYATVGAVKQLLEAFAAQNQPVKQELPDVEALLNQKLQENVPNIINLMNQLNEAEQIKKQTKMDDTKLQAIIAMGQQLGASTVTESIKMVGEIAQSLGYSQGGNGGVVTLPALLGGGGGEERKEGAQLRADLATEAIKDYKTNSMRAQFQPKK